MDDIMHNVLQPLAMAIYMNDHRDVYKQPGGLFADRYAPLRSHHSFTIRYSLGEDTDLSTHRCVCVCVCARARVRALACASASTLNCCRCRDDSDITLNLCLGKQFTGGALFFCNTGVPQVGFSNKPPTPKN